MRGLTKLYHDLNRQFFGGELPSYRVTLCRLVGNTRGQCDSKHRLIRLRRGLAGEALRQVLLHEMCHIRAPDHGRRFQAQLESLADQGESWAREEAEVCRQGSGSWNTEMANMRESLEQTAFMEPRPPFAKVLGWLARGIGHGPRDLLRKAPWLKAAWKKSCRDADAFERSQRTLEERIRREQEGRK